MKKIKIQKSFKREFKKQVRMSITAAIGFLIAFAWRESIFLMATNFTSKILDISQEHYQAQIYSAILMTIIGIIIILITSKIFKEKS